MSLPTLNLPPALAQRIQNRPGVRKAIGNLGWIFWDRLFRTVVGLLVACWTTRMLGPTQYGLLNWAGAWVSFFTILAVLGLDSIVVRDIVRFPEEKNRILGTAFVMKFVGGFAALGLSIGTFLLIRPHVGASERLVSLIIALLAAGSIFQAFDTIDFWYQSQVMSKYVAYARSSTFMVTSTVKLWLIHIHAPAVAFAGAMLLDAVCAATGLYVTYRVNRQSIREWQFSPEWAKSLLGDSWPVILNGIGITVQAHVDQVLLGTMVSQAEVGQFSAAMGLIEAFGFIPMVIYTAVTPLIVKSKALGEEIYYSRLCNLYRLMFLSFLAVSIPLYFVAQPIVVFFLGRKYLEAGGLLALFGIRLLFTNFGVAKNVFIISENLFRYSLVTAIIGSIVNVVLNCQLIPHYRAIGSIWAMIGSFFVTTFLLDAFYPPVRRNLQEMLRAIVTPWRVSVS